MCKLWCEIYINDGFVTLLIKGSFWLLLFFSDSVSSLPCRVCALYGDRCFTEWSLWIPGFRQTLVFVEGVRTGEPQGVLKCY